VESNNIDLQRSASLTFAEITEQGLCFLSQAGWERSYANTMRLIDVREVSRDTLEPILTLLQSPDIEVQRAASAALGNLAVNSTI
jgi:vacuolar protein 8